MGELTEKAAKTVVKTVQRHDGVQDSAIEDKLAVEEPLEIRVAGESVAVTMRTPGDDRLLSLGFLFSEGIVEKKSDVGKVAHCGRLGTPEYGNVIDVLPPPGVNLDPERIRAGRRGTLTSSACGVCGRQKIEDLVDRCNPLTFDENVPVGFIQQAHALMQQHQPVFSQTGGVHAAVICDAQCQVICAYEDVGRHNAVDKSIGALLDAGETTMGEAKILTVSSRASFEIVQKAAMARIPIVAAVSAASSLAVDLAKALGITLVGFVRGDRLVVYSGTVDS